MKKTIKLLLLLLIPISIFAQIYNNNFYLEKIILEQKYNFSNTYLRNLSDYISDSLDNNHIFGIDVSTYHKNNAIDYYSTSNDNGHLLVSPYFHYKVNSKLKVDIRLNMENQKEELVDDNKTYWADNFAGYRGGFEIASIKYKSEHFSVTYGRDYFVPGLVLSENLLFSNHNYSYDQLLLQYYNKYLSVSTYYLKLNSFGSNMRHLNGHRLSINLFDRGYLAFNEIILYGGKNRQFNPMLMNPFINYYMYQKNTKNFESNSILSSELFLQYNKIFFMFEFLVDDYQVDREVISDLEPMEYGLNISIGMKNILKDLNWSMNYTKVSNRTFNAPEKDYEKYIYKNYPIGHFLGNNFWEVKSNIQYNYKNIMNEIDLYYREYGEEALYGKFNKDFMDSNVTMKEGYEENFPFGQIRNQLGITGKGYYKINNYFMLNLEMSYWIKEDFLEKFNFMVGLTFHF